MKRLLVLCFVCAFLACVPTPEEEFVVGKANQSEMIQSARNESNDAQQAPDLRTLYHIPETLSLDLNSRDGMIHVTVDAPILVPDDPLPIVRAYAAEFEQPTVTALWNALVGDAVLYNQWENEETKADIEKDLKLFNDMLEKINSGEQDEPSAMYSADELKEMIADLQSRYSSAPDGYEKTVETGILRRQYIGLGDNSRAASRMGISARSDDEPWINFHVENDTDNTEALVYHENDGWSGISLGRAAHFYYNRTSPGNLCPHLFLSSDAIEEYVVLPNDPIPADVSEFLSVTPEAAYATVTRFLSDTGLDQTLAIARVTIIGSRTMPRDPETQFAYRFELVRTVNGVPCARCADFLVTSFSDDEMTAPYWGYESVELYLDNTGIFNMDWFSPIKVGDAVVERAQLKDFSEILAIAERMLPMMEVKNLQPEFTKSVTRTIDRVELGLWRIVEQNELGKGLLVPVYCFYGTDYYRRDLPDGYSDETYDRYIPLIINAVDGSVIDPNKGY